MLLWKVVLDLDLPDGSGNGPTFDYAKCTFTFDSVPFALTYLSLSAKSN